MAIYDYIIVGGGISGLYMAYQLSKTDKSILIVESTNRWGGDCLLSLKKDLNLNWVGLVYHLNTKKMMSYSKNSIFTIN